MMPIPLEEIRARVLRPTPNYLTGTLCCVCHERQVHYGGERLCSFVGCYAEARRLGWLVV